MANAPKLGYYLAEPGTVILVQTSKRGHWYATALRSRHDGSLAHTYLGRHTDGLTNPVDVEEATDHLCGKAL